MPTCRTSPPSSIGRRRAGANGTQALPYKTLAAGVNNTADFGTVGLFPGTYNEPMTLNRPMTLRSTDDGVVIIGRP